MTHVVGLDQRRKNFQRIAYQRAVPSREFKIWALPRQQGIECLLLLPVVNEQLARTFTDRFEVSGRPLGEFTADLLRAGLAALPQNRS